MGRNNRMGWWWLWAVGIVMLCGCSVFHSQGFGRSHMGEKQVASVVGKCVIGQTTIGQFRAMWEERERLTTKAPSGWCFDLVPGDRYRSEYGTAETIWIAIYPAPLDPPVLCQCLTFHNGVLESIYEP